MTRPRRARRSLLASLLPVAFVASALAAGCARPDGVRVGEEAPAFALHDLSGRVVASDTLAGTPTVVNFWATWCMPCLGELPVLAQVERGGAARVVGIAIDVHDPAEVRRYAAAHQLPYAVLLGDEAVAKRYGVLGIPFTVVLDRRQRVVEVFTGALMPGDLDAALRRAGA
jgi:thiol-disulfide isomerase/thioredoxin